MTIKLRTLAPLAFASTLVACAHDPSSELVSARNVYQQAEAGETYKIAPAKVYEAKKALHEAEEAFDKEPGSDRERDLAYVAHRKAEYAIAFANMKNAEQQEKQARQSYVQTLTSQRDQAMAALQSKDSQLAQTQSQLQTASAQLQDAQAEQQRLANQLTAAMQSLSEMASFRQEQDRLVISLDGAVLFKFDSAELMPIAEQRLQDVAKIIAQYDDQNDIVVQGHTDSRGSDRYNQKLSQDRAESVRQYLVNNGVEAKAVEAVGKGESEPVASNDTPEGRANNRRVEIIIQNQELGQTVTPGQQETPQQEM